MYKGSKKRLTSTEEGRVCNEIQLDLDTLTAPFLFGMAACKNTVLYFPGSVKFFPFTTETLFQEVMMFATAVSFLSKSVCPVELHTGLDSLRQYCLEGRCVVRLNASDLVTAEEQCTQLAAKSWQVAMGGFAILMAMAVLPFSSILLGSTLQTLCGTVSVLSTASSLLASDAKKLLVELGTLQDRMLPLQPSEEIPLAQRAQESVHRICALVEKTDYLKLLPTTAITSSANLLGCIPSS